MNLNQFIEFLIEEGEINGEVIKKSLEVNDFPLTHKILLKIEGQTTLLENILRPKNEGELVLAKGELLRICILNDQDVKQQGIKFIDTLIKKVREKFNLYPSEKKVIKNKNSNKPTSKGNETIQESEEDLSSLIQKAYEFYDLEDYSKAIYFYNQAINLNDHDYTLFFNRGLAHQSLNEFENAIKDFDYALHLFDGDNNIGSSIYYCLGKNYRDLGKYEESIENLDIAIDLNPNDANYFFYRGLSYQELNKYEDSIENFDNAIDLNPNDDRYFFSKGLSFYYLDENEKAIQAFDASIEILSDVGDYFYYRAKAKLDSTEIYKINEIIEDLNKAVSLLDDSSFKEEVLFDRALQFKNKGDYENCLEDLSYLITQSSELKYLEERILIYVELHKYEKAIKDILECCELDPENSLLYKGYLINLRYANPYNDINIWDDLRIETIKRKYQDNSEEWRNKKIKAEIKDINRENGKKNSKGEVLDYLVLESIDSIYKDRIINLFGIDGVEDFRTAVGLRTSSGLDYRY